MFVNDDCAAILKCSLIDGAIFWAKNTVEMLPSSSSLLFYDVVVILVTTSMCAKKIFYKLVLA